METPSPGSPAYWSRFGVTQVDLFASLETAHCKWFYSLSSYGCTGTQLAPGPAQVCIPPVSLLAQTLCKIREDEEQVLLVALYLPSRTWFPGTHAPCNSPSLADSSEEGSAFSETGHPRAPTPWMGCGASR